MSAQQRPGPASSPTAPRAAGTGTLLSREQARALADRVLKLSTADETRVNITSEWAGNTRFADSSITTSGGVADLSVRVTVTIGRRRASASTNVLDDASLKRTVDLAMSLARLSPEDPELMPELGPQSYSAIAAFVERTADLGPEERNAAVKQAVDAAAAAGKPAGAVFTAGFLQANASVVAVATSKGLFAYHQLTNSAFSMTTRTPDQTGSGWAAAGARDWSRIDPAAIGRAAARKAIASRNPQAIAPGLYTAVLEPQAVNDLVPLLSNALNARSADEGRSAFSKPGGGNRIGEKVVDERVTLYSDPVDPALLGRPFDGEGLPVSRTVWIEKGVLKNLAYNRFWAQKQGVQPNGAAIQAGGLALVGGTKSTEEIIAGCERGILVTHFFYIRSLEPRTVLYTGLTRDGVFLIENGKVTRALKNFRWNESPLLMLNRLEEIGRPEPTEAGQLMPALRIRDFNFTSASEAV
ncbi:MAG TPA: TldD/PmbA family protein [Vicinamibacterales bacterium]|nr:TldD/PmbA family protein [Vicinamibacterales bacterium]